MNRDEYVAKLKVRLDQWNADASRWESQARDIKAKQMESFEQRRNEAMYNLKLLENASTAAWNDFASGCDSAWDNLQAAYVDARRHFEKTPPA